VLRAATAALALTFASCAAASSPATTATRGTVTGRVTAGPTCPVERAGHPCPPAPVSAVVQARAHRRVAASTHTDAHGRYTLRLAAGSYTLVAVTKQPYPRCTPRSVRVRASQVVHAAIACDTGIR
jgi:hypothetical protein